MVLRQLYVDSSTVTNEPSLAQTHHDPVRRPNGGGYGSRMPVNSDRCRRANVGYCRFSKKDLHDVQKVGGVTRAMRHRYSWLNLDFAVSLYYVVVQVALRSRIWRSTTNMKKGSIRSFELFSAQDAHTAQARLRARVSVGSQDCLMR